MPDDPSAQPPQEPQGGQAPQGPPHGAPQPEPHQDRRDGRARGENARLRERLERYQRREVEELAGELEDPADLWAEAQLSDLLNDEGEVDPERVSQAQAALIERHPHWARRGPGPLPGNGPQPERPQPQQRTWAEMLRPR